MKYHNTQIGIVIIIIMLSVILLFNYLVKTLNPWPVNIILGVIAFLFSSMTINIKGKKLTWYFGPKFWKNEILLSDIRGLEVVRMNFFDGLGIRQTSDGMLYNVSGLDAVEIKLRNKSIFLGTNEPYELFHAINKRLTNESNVKS